MLFPYIMMALVGFMFLALYMYQQVVLVYVSAVTAERAAYNWDNSYKAAKSGAFSWGEYDGLYWRVGDDRALDVLFGLSGQNTGVTVHVHEQVTDDAALPVRKLSTAAANISGSLEGQLHYENRGWQREISVELNNPIRFVPLEHFMGRVPLQAKVRSTVVEPVEFIRTVELARYYGAKFKFLSETGVTKEKAKKVLEHVSSS